MMKFSYIRLVGRVNTVYTGVVIKYGEKICRFTESAKVKFGNATPEQIQAYVDTGEPLYVNSRRQMWNYSNNPYTQYCFQR